MSPGAKRGLQITAGGLAGNVVGWLACLFYVLVYRWIGTGSANDPFKTLLMYSAFPNLIIVPMVMGIVSAHFWRKLGFRILTYLLLSLLFTVTSIAGAYLFMKEGVVCLAIVSPLLFAGTMLGRVWFRPKENLMRLTIVPLLIVAMFADARLTKERTAMAEDEIVVGAPAAEVWKHVMEFPPIEKPSTYWIDRIGMPSALSTTCEGEWVGAHRRCIFSNGVALEERVAELEHERLMTFDITEQPRDPELLGHLDLHRGQLELRENGDGSTTLIGRSWYTLHVRPLWYFDFWTRDITRHVHMRVMEHIKQLSEKAR
jgi:hypothetical protein